MAHAAQFLRTLPEIEPTTEGSNQFSSDGNSLIIDYGERDGIAISIQSGQSNEETLIHIAPGRIKLAGKFSILTRELYEDNGRDSVGTLDMQVPNTRVHVLLVSPDILRSTVCVQANGDKYYLEWSPCSRNNERLHAAHVTTEFMYFFRRAAAQHGREMIQNPMDYFHGQPVTRERQPNRTEQQQQVANIEAAAAADGPAIIGVQDGGIQPETEQVAVDENISDASDIETLVNVVVAPESHDIAVGERDNVGADHVITPPNEMAIGEPVMDEDIAELLDEQFAIPVEIREIQESGRFGRRSFEN